MKLPFTTLAGLFMMVVGAGIAFIKGDVMNGIGLIVGGGAFIKTAEVDTFKDGFKEPPKDNK
jgi:hypothetical protein